MLGKRKADLREVAQGEMKKLGGTDLERLFLEDSQWADKTDIPGVDMSALIARHKGRYALCGLFLRPGMKFLDFPCGSGYASELLAPYGARYFGMDGDQVTVAHAAKNYRGTFAEGDLTEPQLMANAFDVIACIEGIEHIEQKYHAPLIKAFYNALKPGGTLIVSCPRTNEKVSGPNPDNPYHLCELTDYDFDRLFIEFDRLQTLYHSEVLSTGKEQTMMFGIARK